MTETAFFEALVWGAYFVGGIAFGYGVREAVGWLLRNWPASKGKVGD